MAKFNLVDYEIWGNSKDGFWVNDCFFSNMHKNIDIPEDILYNDTWQNEKLIKFLKHKGIIKKGVHINSIIVEGEPDFTLYFSDVRKEVGRYCPIFELQRAE